MKSIVESAEKYLFDEDTLENNKEIGHCKDCQYWSVDYSNECGQVGFADILKDNSAFELDYGSDDDSGLYARLLTGPNFGCIQFKKKV